MYRRARIGLGGDYLGRDRGPAPPAESARDLGRDDWLSDYRGDRFFVLWIRRPVGEVAGSDGDERHHAALVFSPGLYWRPDFLEWGKSVDRVPNQMKWRLTLASEQGRFSRHSSPDARF